MPLEDEEEQQIDIAVIPHPAIEKGKVLLLCNEETLPRAVELLERILQEIEHDKNEGLNFPSEIGNT